MTDALSQQPWWLAGWSRHVSPSALSRVAACVRSEAMPHAFEVSEAAGKGTVAHKFLADCQNHGRDRALGMVEDTADIEWLMMLDLERLPAFQRESYEAEAALAYNLRTRTSRLLGYNLTREQARAKATDEELVGLMDVLGETDESVVVHDYKTGYGYVEPAKDNWQLKTYALMAARWRHKTHAKYSIIRTRDNGSTWFDAAEMDELELLVHEEALIDLLESRAAVRDYAKAGSWDMVPPFVQGKHCRYCPALAFCPAKTHGLKELVQKDADSGPPSGPLTAAEAAEAWRKVQWAKKTLSRWEAVLEDLARQTPIPLGGDEVLGEKTVTSEVIIPERARPVFERQWGSLGAALASEATEVKATLTKKALRSGLRKLILDTLPPDHQKITWLERDAMKLLREGGALTVKVTKPVCEHVPLAPKALPEGETEAA